MCEKLNQRKRILEIAKELFLSFGYSKVSMGDIASRLGMSKKTLYVYYEGKESLLNAVIDDYRDDITSHMDVIFKDDTKDIVEQGREIFSYIGAKISAINPYMIEDIYKNAPQAWEKIQQIKKDSAYKLFQGVLDEGARKGIVRKDINRTLAVLLYMSATETIINPNFTRNIPKEMMSEIPFSTSAIFEGLVKIIFEGVLER
ncbi:MAG: TetR/AcrR family transcriptional regulator [Bacteroidales bacterium]|nr:TetR/AcrR family transcriptional regulator [Bacteroidales bacterium]